MWNRESKPSTPLMAPPVTHFEPALQTAPVASDAVAPPAPAAAAKAKGSTLVIKGEVSAAEDLVLEGRVEGTISLPDHVLTVGLGSELAATVSARVVVLHGTLTGDINAFERAELKSSGTMAGDLVTPKVQMSDGASFTGRLETRTPAKDAGRQGQKDATRVA